MKNKKLLTVICIFLLSSASLIMWRNVTDGFRPHKVVGMFENSLSPPSLSLSEKERIKKILDQKFEYLSKGSQVFAFISEDEKYVLKFVRLSKYVEPFRRKFLPFFSKKAKKEKNFFHVINSYNIAFETLQKETKIVYFHFKKDPFFCKKIKIIDKTGIVHQLDANNCMFLLQKKGEKIKSKILNSLKKNDLSYLKKSITEYLTLAKKIVKKGILNKDSSIKNLGYIDGQLSELDLGRFEKIKINKENFCFYFNRYTQLYRNSLKQNPEILDFFDQSLKEFEERE